MPLQVLALNIIDNAPITVSTSTVSNIGKNLTYYVRTSGGDSTQCNGLYDLNYSGVGTAQNCAFSSPYWALGAFGGTPIMASGDTLIIEASEFMIGMGASGATGSGCSESWAYDCYLGAVPSGTSGNPTRILGANYSNGCSTKSTLWGSKSSQRVLNLADSDWVEVQCLELTDKEECGGGKLGTPYTVESGTACDRNIFPHGDYGQTGLYATNSDNIYLKDINIHGMAYSGMTTAEISNWKMVNVDISYNSEAGWKGDVGGVTNNTGYIEWVGGNVDWNGCIESLTTAGTVKDSSCTGEDSGNYSDGIGMDNTGGTWILKDLNVSNNVQDGIDLLYVLNTGQVIIENLFSSGNGGNNVKVGNTSSQNRISDSTLIGNCTAMSEENPAMLAGSATFCRAGGEPIAVTGNTLVERSTVYTSGSAAFLTTERNGETASITFEDSILYIGNRPNIGAQDPNAIEAKAGVGYNSESGNNLSTWTFNNTIIFDPSIYVPVFTTFYTNNVLDNSVSNMCELSTSLDPVVTGCADPVFTELPSGDGPTTWFVMPSLTVDPASPYYNKPIGDYL